MGMIHNITNTFLCPWYLQLYFKYKIITLILACEMKESCLKKPAGFVLEINQSIPDTCMYFYSLKWEILFLDHSLRAIY